MVFIFCCCITFCWPKISVDVDPWKGKNVYHFATRCQSQHQMIGASLEYSNGEILSHRYLVICVRHGVTDIEECLEQPFAYLPICFI